MKELIQVCKICHGERRNDGINPVLFYDTPCQLCGANNWGWKDIPESLLDQKEGER
jgi:hypothetical protein